MLSVVFVFVVFCFVFVVFVFVDQVWGVNSVEGWCERSGVPYILVKWEDTDVKLNDVVWTRDLFIHIVAHYGTS